MLISMVTKSFPKWCIYQNQALITITGTVLVFTNDGSATFKLLSVKCGLKVSATVYVYISRQKNGDANNNSRQQFNLIYYDDIDVWYPQIYFLWKKAVRRDRAESSITHPLVPLTHQCLQMNTADEITWLSDTNNLANVDAGRLAIN